MRFVLAAIFWVVIVGGLWLYTGYRDAAVSSIVPAQGPAMERVEVFFDLEITPTFTVEKDPFALATGDGETAVELLLNGTPLPLPAEALQRGRPTTVRDISGIIEGRNELLITASPPVAESHLDHAVRLRLLRGQEVVVASTLWGGGGSLVSGTIAFTIDAGEEDRHDHQ